MADSRAASRHAQVVCGTPGRILDCIRRGWLDLRDLKTLIVDEADEMLSRGFVDQLRDIVHEVPTAAQVCFCYVF